jgi:hypothetical protein
MLKRVWIFLLFIGLALAACSGNAQPTVQTTQEPYQPAAPAATTAPKATETQASEPASASTTSAAPAGCTVVSAQPTPGPTEQSLFPPANDQDQIEGPDDAYVTILEYGDFQ